MNGRNFNQQRDGGTFGNRPQRQEKEKKTFEQLAEDVRKQFFSDTFSELLNMNKASNLDHILKKIEEFVSEEGKNLTTSQLRNIYDKAIKAQDLNALKLIRPNLAYIAGRNTTTNNEKSLLAFIDLLIKSVQSDEQVKGFKTFFEAVVAYHKFYGKTN